MLTINDFKKIGSGSKISLSDLDKEYKSFTGQSGRRTLFFALDGYVVRVKEYGPEVAIFEGIQKTDGEWHSGYFPLYGLFPEIREEIEFSFPKHYTRLSLVR